jgi:hypothetical protein
MHLFPSFFFFLLLPEVVFATSMASYEVYGQDSRQIANLAT